MQSIFAKPLEAITAADLGNLCTAKWPEGETVEFKREVPSDKGEPSWSTDPQQPLLAHGRNAIFKAVVAFANAQGGTLFIGVTESDDEPRTAVALAPVPRCGELALNRAGFAGGSNS
jgi:predicted HTH transcriptional regulator